MPLLPFFLIQIILYHTFFFFAQLLYVYRYTMLCEMKIHPEKYIIFNIARRLYTHTQEFFFFFSRYFKESNGNFHS